MNLAKTTFFSAISTFIKLLSALVINKAVSVFIGPVGLALIGQFQNFLNVVQIIAKLGINNGVTKLTAEYKSKNISNKDLFSTSFIITVVSSITVGLIVFIFSKSIASLVLNDIVYEFIFRITGVSLVFFSINQLLLSIINGLGEIGEYIRANIIQSIYALFFTSALIYLYSLEGALVSMVLGQAVVFLYLAYRLSKLKLFNMSCFFGAIKRTELRKLLNYSIMALVTAVCVPLVSFYIRDLIANTTSWEDAGYWQAINYISNMYLLVITTALSTYYLPKLSSLSDKKEIRNELKKGMVTALPVVVAMAITIFFLKGYIVKVLFSSDFKPMVYLFKYQLLGDVVKVAAWFVSYLMLAKSLTRIYVLTEVFHAFNVIILSFYFVNFNGVIGATQAYFVSYILYLAIVLFVMRKHLY